MDKKGVSYSANGDIRDIVAGMVDFLRMKYQEDLIPKKTIEDMPKLITCTDQELEELTLDTMAKALEKIGIKIDIEKLKSRSEENE